MSIDVSEIGVGRCYRADAEVRQVRAVQDDEVSYVVVVHSFRETSVGPLQCVPRDRFAREVAACDACP